MCSQNRLHPGCWSGEEEPPHRRSTGSCRTTFSNAILNAKHGGIRCVPGPDGGDPEVPPEITALSELGAKYNRSERLAFGRFR
jgi:hypothetical protein